MAHRSRVGWKKEKNRQIDGSLPLLFLESATFTEPLVGLGYLLAPQSLEIQSLSSIYTGSCKLISNYFYLTNYECSLGIGYIYYWM